ncbi:MAG: SUMF1/EgtB/PvdO family nonheme iron enzyme [Candidatus Pacebacteria bacterium]|nr:SUMF1/EgtB/PvdO family nonheme iron enzyme [Candidatus Paceibacterota bacterium]
MFDGLDEVTSELRFVACRMIKRFYEHFPNNWYIVTCRTTFYRGESKIAGFSDCELKPLTFQQIDIFIEKWYHSLVDSHSISANRANDLIHDLKKAVKPLYDLACNPLLLTSIAIVHRAKLNLPTERVRLYDLVCNILIHRWPREKMVEYEKNSNLVAIDHHEQEVYSSLYELAYKNNLAEIQSLHRGISEEEAIRIFANYFNDNFYLAKEYLTYLVEQAGLLRYISTIRSNTLEFLHKCFQDYFAAKYLIDSGLIKTRVRELLSDMEAWKMPLRLAIEDLVYRTRITPIAIDCISKLCPNSKPKNELDWRGIILAGEFATIVGEKNICLTNSGMNLWKRLVKRLTKIIIEGLLSINERIEAAKILSVLNDPREGICSIPPKWIYISTKVYKKFQIKPFYIARYPVTNQQYLAFYKNNDYKIERYWTKSGLEWLKSLELNWFTKFEKSNQLMNEPVTNVSWFEAVAFCRWMTELLFNQGEIGEDEEIRLPSHIEWQVAACGAENRRFPWGDKNPTIEHANYLDSLWEQPVPVGIYTKGATPGSEKHRIFDMAGNVWEWCSTRWGKDWNRPSFTEPYTPNDGREDLEGHDRRYLKGGAWFNRDEELKSATFATEDPNTRSAGIGFRVCRAVRLI